MLFLLLLLFRAYGYHLHILGIEATYNFCYHFSCAVLEVERCINHNVIFLVSTSHIHAGNKDASNGPEQSRSLLERRKSLGVSKPRTPPSLSPEARTYAIGFEARGFFSDFCSAKLHLGGTLISASAAE